VLPARLYGVKEGTGAKIEIFLHKRLGLKTWEVLMRPGKRCKAGSRIKICDELTAVVQSDTEFGGKIVDFEYEGVFEEILVKVGNTPLPQYIKTKLERPERYQTVYAKQEGSSAAPTAGLHFTDELLQKIRAKGVQIVEVLLHVGLGTFRPVKTDNIKEHHMHSEYYTITKESADIIKSAKQNGHRVVAVGTTSVRVLESVITQHNDICEASGNTEIFIYPGYKFQVVDALITNFHLPESTLIMLVSAFCGLEETMSLYKLAIENKYRFFSFGDAMFLH